MTLTPELFNEIAATTIVTGRDEPRVADRRSPRLKLNSHLSVCFWSDPSTPISLRVRDLSTGGLGLYHAERVALDEQIVVRLPRPAGQSTLVLGHVVYWEPIAENVHGIGVQFERLVDEAELASRAQSIHQHQQAQAGVVTRFTQAVARSWRIAS